MKARFDRQNLAAWQPQFLALLPVIMNYITLAFRKPLRCPAGSILNWAPKRPRSFSESFSEWSLDQSPLSVLHRRAWLEITGRLQGPNSRRHPRKSCANLVQEWSRFLMNDDD